MVNFDENKILSIPISSDFKDAPSIFKEKIEKDGDEGNYLSDKRREKPGGMGFFRKSGKM